MLEEILEYKFIFVPILVWFGIQFFKVIYLYFETKKWNWSRIWGAGGMPSSHTAVVTCLATMVGKNAGINSMIFAVSAFFAFIVMYDAAGVRRVVGKQSKIINNILMDSKKSGAEKLQEMTGHTPFQVAAGALIGISIGLFF